MGVFATVVLVALIALSGTAVYLTAPRNNGDGPTQLPAGSRALMAGGTPQGTLATPPVDYTPVRTGGCYLQQSITYDTVMATVLASSMGRPNPVFPITFNLNPGSEIKNPGGVAIVGYPAPMLQNGVSVVSADNESVTSLFGSYLSCVNPLQAALLFTNEGLYRYYTSGGVIGADRATVASRYLDLWRFNQKDRESAPIETPAAAAWQQPGQWFLFGYRWIDANRIGAYVGFNSLSESNPSWYNPEAAPGIVVFVRDQVGTWRIDEFLAPPSPPSAQ